MEVSANKTKSGIKKLFSKSDTMVLLATILLALVFSIFSESFFSAFNLFNVSRTAALYMFVALAQAMVIIVGGMNLALGQIGGLTVIIAGYCMDVLHFSTMGGILVGLSVGLLCGLLNSLVMIKLRLSSFISTLAMSFVYGGIITGICEGFPYTNIPANFSIIGTEGFSNYLPYLLVLSVVVLAVMWYVFKYTVIGRRLLATGGNQEAARLAGININKMLITANMSSGFFAAVAGLLLSLIHI